MSFDASRLEVIEAPYPVGAVVMIAGVVGIWTVVATVVVTLGDDAVNVTADWSGQYEVVAVSIISGIMRAAEHGHKRLYALALGEQVMICTPEQVQAGMKRL